MFRVVVKSIFRMKVDRMVNLPETLMQCETVLLDFMVLFGE